jgi:hypothetical protein
MSNDAAFARALESSRRTRIDRRQLLKAGAWATPAVVLATAAPAHAASGVTIQVANIQATATAGKGAEATYAGTVTVTNDTTKPVSVTVILTSADVAVAPTPAEQTVIVPAAGTESVSFTMGTANNGAGKTVTASVSSTQTGLTLVGRTVSFQGGQSFSG